jgi:hypothetical protein
MTPTGIGTPQQRRADLIGGPAFWLAALLTIAALIAWGVWHAGRLWLGAAVLLMWTAFSAVNAFRCGRVHSVMTAPVYLLGAAAMGLDRLGQLDARRWLPWVLAAGLILAHAAERRLGRYLRRP